MWYQLREKPAYILQELLQLSVAPGNTLADLCQILWKPEFLTACNIFSTTDVYYHLDKTKPTSAKSNETATSKIYRGHLGITMSGELYLLWIDTLPAKFEFETYQLHLFLHPNLLTYLEKKELGYQLESRESILLYAALSYSELENDLLTRLDSYKGTEAEDEQLSELLIKLENIHTDYTKKIANHMERSKKQPNPLAYTITVKEN